MPDALASVEDVLALTGDDQLDEDKLEAMLASASARFRREARCDFTETETTAALVVSDGRVTLRGPVISVDSVNLVDTDGTAGDAIGWTFDGLSTVTVARRDPVAQILDPRPYTPTVWVTWTHGFETVPEDVRWAVAAMVERAIGTPDSGVAGETIGGYSWRGGGYTASGALSMTRDEIAVAHSYRPKAASVPLR